MKCPRWKVGSCSGTACLYWTECAKKEKERKDFIAKVKTLSLLGRKK